MNHKYKQLVIVCPSFVLPWLQGIETRKISLHTTGLITSMSATWLATAYSSPAAVSCLCFDFLNTLTQSSRLFKFCLSKSFLQHKSAAYAARVELGWRLGLDKDTFVSCSYCRQHKWVQLILKPRSEHLTLSFWLLSILISIVAWRLM